MPNDTDLIIAVSLQPIKINIDQYVIRFLLDELTLNIDPESRRLSSSEGIPKKARYVHRFTIDAFSVNVDFRPHEFGMTPGGLLNIFPVNLKIMLPRIDIRGADNVEDALKSISRQWVEFIWKQERLNVIGGIGPLSTIRNLGAALTNLVKLPIESFSREGDLTSGARSAVAMLLQTCTTETFESVQSAVKWTKALLGIWFVLVA